MNGERHGNGIEYYRDGKGINYCEYLYGKIIWTKNYLFGQIIFEGECWNSVNKKRGKEYRYGILEYEGEYLYGKKWTGKGYDEKHNIIYELNNGNGNN